MRLPSRPRETSSVAFLNELLNLFKYPSRSALALLNGTLPLRYCAARFASKIPLGDCLLEVMLLTLLLKVVRRWALFRLSLVGVELTGLAGWVGGGRRVRLNRKTPAHLVGRFFLGSQSRQRVWKRSDIRDHLDGARADSKRRCLYQQDEACVPAQDRTGGG